MPGPNFLIVRLGAMGDILHALPAAASLKASFGGSRLCWAVHPKWRGLLEGGGLADRIIPVQRSGWRSLAASWRELRAERFDLVLDCQGLVQSALVARVARAPRVIGFARPAVRETPACWFYTTAVGPQSRHMVDRTLELAAAAGAVHRAVRFPLPPGRPEGSLPTVPFVLTSPLAGWRAKQWPEEYYTRLARLIETGLGMPLVVNGAPRDEAALRAIPGVAVHLSSVAGLIDATRRATAVLGLDSGPLHLAAALEKPGVALFGPTDPARNGPYSRSLTVLRQADAPVSYKRGNEIHPSMRALTPEPVFEALRASIRSATPAAP
jgi:heptosyltransferase-1